MKLYQEFKNYQISKLEQNKLYWRWRLLRCEKSKSLLANSFLPMILKIASKYLGRHRYITDLSELLAEGYIATHKAIETYDGRSKLSTYTYLMVHWRIRRFLSNLYCMVKMTQYGKAQRKIERISLNPKYIEEINNRIYFVDERTPLDTIIKEMDIQEGSKVLERLPKTYITKVERGKTIPQYVIEKARQIYEEMEV